MALFKNMMITTKGMTLYAKAQAGQEIHFTKMQVGSGQIGTQNPAVLNALIDAKLDVPITSITPIPELKSARIVGNITNKDVLEAIYICEIGLFANDPEEGEVLYGYASSGEYGDYYAPEAQGPYSWQYEINAAIGNAANVTAELSLSNWDYSVTNSNTTFVKVSGGNQKEINKCIDDWINKHELNFKKIDGNFEQVNTHLDEITKDIDNIDLSANKVKLNKISGMNATEVQAAIQELFQFANDGKKNWVDVIGSPLVNTDTFSTLKSKTQSLKNTMASNLKSKGQSADNQESLNSLINKIGNIELSNLKIVSGSGTYNAITDPYFINLGFRPYIIITHASADYSSSSTQKYLDLPTLEEIEPYYWRTHEEIGSANRRSRAKVSEITDIGFKIECAVTNEYIDGRPIYVKWYAIGVKK